MRAMTSISVRPMSVPIANCRLMNAPPAFAKDWVSWRPARPRSACSCGSISSDSTSVGAAARQPVKIVMTGSSMSGKSCTGSLMSATMPSTMMRPTPTATPTGLFNDLSVRFTLASLLMGLMRQCRKGLQHPLAAHSRNRGLREDCRRQRPGAGHAALSHDQGDVHLGKGASPWK